MLRPAPNRHWFLLVAALALAACSSRSTFDTGVDDIPGEPPECTPPEEACGSICSDYQSDPDNCGSCGSACDAGQVCVGGECQAGCPSSQMRCGTLCASIMTDRTNCGSCGHACSMGQRCAMGRCL